MPVQQENKHTNARNRITQIIINTQISQPISQIVKHQYQAAVKKRNKTVTSSHNTERIDTHDGTPHDDTTQSKPNTTQPVPTLTVTPQHRSDSKEHKKYKTFFVDLEQHVTFLGILS